MFAYWDYQWFVGVCFHSQEVLKPFFDELFESWTCLSICVGTLDTMTLIDERKNTHFIYKH